MKTKFVAALCCAAALIGATPAEAAKIYTATLSGGAENPPVVTGGTGSALATINNALSSLTLSVVFFGLTGRDKSATINCCSVPSLNAPIAINLAGFPLNTKAGSYTHVFNLLSNATYTNPFRLANGGTALSARNALVAGLDNSRGYINIGTAFKLTGEVRGQLAPLQAVPEPMEWALLMIGSMASGVMLRRQSRGRRQVKFVLA